MSREAFVAEITRDVPETPVYFLHSRDMNQAGPALLAGRDLPPALEAPAFAKAFLAGAIVLDTRPAADYCRAHVPKSLHVGLDGQYASWVGTLVKPSDKLLLVAEPGREEEAVLRLARVGYENVIGMLAGGFEAWPRARLPVASVKIEDVVGAMAGVGPPAASGKSRGVIDVRRPGEWNEGHVEGAVHIPLSELPARAKELDPNREWLVMCASGYRSVIGASVLERAGFTRVATAVGGMDALRRAGRVVAG